MGVILSNNFNNIPAELRALRQWCLWRSVDIGAAKPTKIPFQINGQKASVTNPEHWSSFNEVCRILATSPSSYSGIGYVFSNTDNFSFIDLDHTEDAAVLAKQQEIFKTFASYSELSPSGQGLHIIVKGNVPQGRRRNCIEIYSNERYATFTGNVYLNEPIRECQKELLELWESLGNITPQQFDFKSQPETQSDKEIIRIASEAANGNKFQALFNGEWGGLYPSQSEADFSLINMIAFYTKNKMQVVRIFRLSVLGKRDKAKRSDYIGKIVDRAFDRELPPIDMDALKIEVENEIRESSLTVEPTAHNSFDGGSTPSSPTIYNVNHNAEAVSTNGKSEDFGSSNLGSIPSTATNTKTNKSHLAPPPGLLGEIAQFIYQSAPRPVPEIAIAAAIGLMAGICGRAYNVSRTGLNQYVILLAETGRGKEAAKSGITKLITAVSEQVPSIKEILGPSEIASGPALFKQLARTPCFLSIWGEFGLRFQSIADTQANNAASNSLRRMILEFYQESGITDIAPASVYSEKEKNIAAIASPALSILGESTPHTFYRSLHEEMISEGLLPRFLLIEYTGERVKLNKAHSEIRPSADLIDKLAQIAANAAAVQASSPRRVITVGFSDAAHKVADNYEELSTNFINNKSSSQVTKELYNRAHLKVLKLAAIVAVGINMWNPTIEESHLQWAIGMVDDDIKTLTEKFETGKIGANTQEIKQIDEVVRVIKEYATGEWKDVVKYSSAKDRPLHAEKVIPYSYISKRLISCAAFRVDKMGATFAIKRTLQILLDRDHIQELSREQLKTKFGTTQKSYMITNVGLLKEE